MSEVSRRANVRLAAQPPSPSAGKPGQEAARARGCAYGCAAALATLVLPVISYVWGAFIFVLTCRAWSDGSLQHVPLYIYVLLLLPALLCVHLGVSAIRSRGENRGEWWRILGAGMAFFIGVPLSLGAAFLGLLLGLTG